MLVISGSGTQTDEAVCLSWATMNRRGRRSTQKTRPSPEITNIPATPTMSSAQPTPQPHVAHAAAATDGRRASLR